MEDRKQFFARFSGINLRDRMMVELAYNHAKFSHRAQRREEKDVNGEPLRVFEHARRAALIALDELKIVDWELATICLLHDVVEDTDYATETHLEVWFTSRVAECVGLITKLPKAGYVERLSACGEWRALVAKACDTLDNLRSMDACDPEKRARKLVEYGEKYRPIWDRMIEIVPCKFRHLAEGLRDSLYGEIGRLEAL